MFNIIDIYSDLFTCRYIHIDIYIYLYRVTINIPRHKVICLMNQDSCFRTFIVTPTTARSS